MKVAESSFRIKTIRCGDPEFIMIDKKGFVNIPRASFEINRACPENYKQIISDCISNGWLKPVVHMKESEWVCEKLGE